MINKLYTDLDEDNAKSLLNLCISLVGIDYIPINFEIGIECWMSWLDKYSPYGKYSKKTTGRLHTTRYPFREWTWESIPLIQISHKDPTTDKALGRFVVTILHELSHLKTFVNMSYTDSLIDWQIRKRDLSLPAKHYKYIPTEYSANREAQLIMKQHNRELLKLAKVLFA